MGAEKAHQCPPRDGFSQRHRSSSRDKLCGTAIRRGNKARIWQEQSATWGVRSPCRTTIADTLLMSSSASSQRRLDVDEIAGRLRAGDRASLARAITLVESRRADPRAQT